LARERREELAAAYPERLVRLVRDLEVEKARRRARELGLHEDTQLLTEGVHAELRPDVIALE
jgi:hypothetical protein